jgi:hypothetical protein
VELLGVWRAVIVDERPVIEADRVDDERVTFVVADRLAVIGGFGLAECGTSR